MSAVASLLAASVFVLTGALALVPLESHDLWWHLRAGELILRQGQPPAHNLFSFTAPDHSWITHEWLSEVLFYLVYSRLGPTALALLKVFVVGAAFTLLYRAALDAGRSAWCAAPAAIVAAWSARFTFDLRPQILTLLLLSLTLVVLLRFRRGGDRAPWTLVPLLWLWANLHSGFVVGLGVILLACLTFPKRRPLLAASVLATATTLATPNHWHGLWYPVAVSRTSLFTNTLTEWLSPDFHSSWLWGFEALLLGSAALLAVSPIRPNSFELLSLLVFAHLALQHQRHVLLFAAAVTPILGRHLGAVLKQPDGMPLVPPRLQALLAAGALAAATALFGAALPRGDLLAAVTCRTAFPEAAAAVLSSQPPLRLYNAYRWGGYLIWRLYPRQRVFVDGRADAYPLQVLEDYLCVERLQPGWEDVLDRYRIEAVIHDTNSGLSDALRRNPRWRPLHVDPVASVFVRAGADAEAAP